MIPLTYDNEYGYTIFDIFIWYDAAVIFAPLNKFVIVKYDVGAVIVPTTEDKSKLYVPNNFVAVYPYDGA